MQLPPWTLRRRLITAGVMTSFILAASLLIGMGMYQIGVDQGWIKQSFTKQTISQALMQDGRFFRAVRKAVEDKKCTNTFWGFEYVYQYPLKQVISSGTNLCTQLVALHSTGADVLINIKPIDEPREVVVNRQTQSFSSVNASMLTGTKYPTSLLSGIRNGKWTNIYVIGVAGNRSFEITYAPTDPTLDNKVHGLVNSFYSMPQ